ncbi:MAG: enoyl-CoA hydratase/isomerase family protein [Pseudomonadota bacterium]
MSRPGRVILEKRGKVALIVLNSPETSNALDTRTGAELEQALSDAARDPDIKAAVLTGQGPNFSSGANVKAIMAELQKHPDKTSGDILGNLVRPFTGAASLLTDMEKPVIGAVKGTAAGGGLALALACDLIVAAASARFDPVYLRLGLVPVGGLTYLAPRLMGLKKAAEFFFLARALSAAEACEFGLVNRVVAEEEVLPTALGLAEAMAAQPGLGLSRTKRLLNGSCRRELLEAMENENQALRECAEHPEHRGLFEKLFQKLS